MRVGLVVVTHNSRGEIARCLACVSNQSRLPERIIIADSDSTDGTIDVITRLSTSSPVPVELFRFNENVGFAVANNRAVERLDDCELVALLNPDAFPDTEWLAALVEAAAVFKDAASFASRLMVAGKEDLLDGVGDVFHVSGLAWRAGHRQKLADVSAALTAGPVFAACAAAALYRREDWIRAGGFDERYFCYAEDVDLGFRLQLLGRGCRYVPEAVVEHVGSAVSGAGSRFSVYHGYRNLEWTFIKNMPSSLLWRYLPLHVLTVFAEIAWFVTRGRGGSVIRSKWDALRGLSWVLRERRRVQSARVATDERIRGLLDRTSPLSRWAAVRSRGQARSQ